MLKTEKKKPRQGWNKRQRNQWEKLSNLTFSFYMYENWDTKFPIFL